ncbi:hypothetical protein SDC9_122317 [bioreactor metagenome]|uniref:Uncharacterized protein n=1 Tax=bioreactor metagenome TaxID=1076179 RepID=A0A645CEJ4_9ZZZZ
MIAKEKDDGIIKQTPFLQVIHKDSHPCIDVFHSFKMKSVVRSHFRNIRQMCRKRSIIHVDTIFSKITASIQVIRTNTSHMCHPCIIDGEERFVGRTVGTIVRSLIATFVPADFIVGGGIVIRFSIVGTIITGIAQQLRIKDVRRCRRA